MAYTPNLTSFYMESTLNTELNKYETTTWHIDMANALNATILGFFDKMIISWGGGVVGPGTSAYPMAGFAGQVITPVVFTPMEIKAACQGMTSVVGLFTLIGSKLEVPFSIMLGMKVGPGFVPQVLVPQVLKFISAAGGSVSVGFANIGAQCFAELEGTETQKFVDDKALFLHTFDKYLALALNTLTATLIVAGATNTGGVIAGTGQVKGNVIGSI